MDEKTQVESPGKTAVDKLPLRPNMLLTNARATSSTFASIGGEHCVFTNSNFFNSLFHRTNLEGCSFVSCDFDGTVFENCSLDGVVLKNCSVEGLVIDGIHIGALLRMLLTGKEG